jgi:hypothetical protein
MASLVLDESAGGDGPGSGPGNGGKGKDKGSRKAKRRAAKQQQPDQQARQGTQAKHMPSVRPKRRRPTLGEWWLGETALLGLAGVAITQPILDLFGRNPEFFIAGRYQVSQIVTFGLLVALVPGLIAVLITTVAWLTNARVGVVLHCVAIALFAFLLGLVVLGNFGVAVLWQVGPGAALLAAVVVWLERTRKQARTLLSYLAVGNVAFLLLFLFGSPTAEIVSKGGGGEVSTTGVVVPPLHGPVVFVILDEFPVATLMQADGALNAERYPNFARLADSSTWFRNAASPYSRTSIAVPAVLTGRHPGRGDLPSYLDHPRNLFTLFGNRYPINLYESVTDMCPPSACSESERPEAGSTGTALRDSAVVYGHQVLPEELSGDLPDIDHSWGSFGDDLAGASADGPDESPPRTTSTTSTTSTSSTTTTTVPGGFGGAGTGAGAGGTTSTTDTEGALGSEGVEGPEGPVDLDDSSFGTGTSSTTTTSAGPLGSNPTSTSTSVSTPVSTPTSPSSSVPGTGTTLPSSTSTTVPEAAVVGASGYGRWSAMPAEERSGRGQLNELRQMVTTIEAEPSLNFVHVALPHYPWNLTPWGTQLTQAPAKFADIEGEEGKEMGGILRYQLHSLQVGAADAAIGEMIDHLQSIGAWDDALVVVTSDHGTSLTLPDFGRRPTENNHEELLRMPLFIKAPGQTLGEGEIDDDVAQTLDVVPSIADLLDIETDGDWDFEGHSLYDGSETPERDQVDDDLQPIVDVAANHASDFGGYDWEGLAAIGIGRDLVGQQLSDVTVSPTPSSLTWKATDEELFASLPTADGRVPYLVDGRVTMPDDSTPPELLLVVNGTIAGVAGSPVRKDGEWQVMGIVGPWFIDGANTVEAYELEPGPLGSTLHRLDAPSSAEGDEADDT